LSRTIYHILPETEPFSEFSGGAISRWVANVLRSDDDAVVLCPSTDGSWKMPELRVTEIPHFATYSRFREIAHKISWPVRRMVLRQIMRPALEPLRPGDLVWLHNRPDLAAAIRPIVHAAQAKLVVHMHNSFLAHRSPRRVREIQADRYVFVSQYLKGEAMENVHDLPNTCVVYNGADRRVFYPRKDGTTSANGVPTILLASRLVPDKGAHVFVEAMRELERRKVEAKGIIVGASKFGGSKETPYVRQLHADAPSNIMFHPYCIGAELGDVFRSADIFCIPSIWQDPFPLAPLEAMACRLPVVATRSGGIPEAFRDGGAIIVPRNSVPELADALQKLVENAELRQSLAQSGEESFHRNFTWNAVRDQYQSVVEATV